jgi:hypothetical protein
MSLCRILPLGDSITLPLCLTSAVTRGFNKRTCRAIRHDTTLFCCMDPHFFFLKKRQHIHQNSRSPKLQLKLSINMGHSVIIPFAKVVSFQEKHLSWQIYNVDDIQLYYDI